MTLKEAYEKAKMDNAPYGLTRLIGCGDYGEFWSFIFAPEDYDGQAFGGGSTIINKKTGEVGTFTPSMRVDLHDKGIKPVEVPISQVMFQPTRLPAKPVRPSITKKQKLAYA